MIESFDAGRIAGGKGEMRELPSIGRILSPGDINGPLHLVGDLYVDGRPV
jgi:hypothetical protein